jgi:hypothetical protein
MNDKGFEVIIGGNNEPVDLPEQEKPSAAIPKIPVIHTVDRHPKHPSRSSIPINPSTGGPKVVPDSLLKRQVEAEGEGSNPAK